MTFIVPPKHEVKPLEDVVSFPKAKPEEIGQLLDFFSKKPIQAKDMSVDSLCPTKPKLRKVHGKKYKTVQPSKPRHKKGKGNKKN